MRTWMMRSSPSRWKRLSGICLTTNTRSCNTARSTTCPCSSVSQSSYGILLPAITPGVVIHGCLSQVCALLAESASSPPKHSWEPQRTQQVCTLHEVQSLKSTVCTCGGCPGSSSPFPANVMRVPSFQPGCTLIVMTSCSHALPVNPLFSTMQHNELQVQAACCILPGSMLHSCSVTVACCPEPQCTIVRRP